MGNRTIANTNGLEELNYYHQWLTAYSKMAQTYLMLAYLVLISVFDTLKRFDFTRLTRRIDKSRQFISIGIEAAAKRLSKRIKNQQR